MTKKDSIFLAYASEDRVLVYELYEKLRIENFNPWLNDFNIMGGQNWKTEIFNAIQKSVIFIACISNHSIQKEGFVQKEFRYALDIYAQKPSGSIFLIPLKLDECDVPDIRIHELGISLRDIHWINYFQPDSFTKLKQSINNALNSSTLGKRNTNIEDGINDVLPSIRVGVIHNKGLTRIFRVYINNKKFIIKFIYNFYTMELPASNLIQVFVNDEIAYNGRYRHMDFTIHDEGKTYASKIMFQDNESKNSFLNIITPRKITGFSFEIEGKIYYSE